MGNGGDSSSLAAEAYSVVRRRILRGELAMGQVISRRKLALELGMSFLPVSEALLRLEFEGLLESRPRAGTRIRIPSRDEVTGHYVVRDALETRAAMICAERATPEERDELLKLALRVDASVTHADRAKYPRLHHKLHRRIADCTGCGPLINVIENTNALVTIWLCAIRQPADSASQHRHQALVEVICEGPPEKAADAMRQHLAVSLQHTLECLKPFFKRRKESGRTFVRGERHRNVHIVKF